MQILTPTGFQKYQRIIKKTGECIKLVFEDSDVTCSLDHRFDNDGVEVAASTLKIGDVVIAGTHYGKVKAMFNERNQRITEAGPSEPALILGLDGAPQAGDNFNVLGSEQEAREIANKREQLQREQGLRAGNGIITLDEIARRRALGNFQEMNIIVKGDVDGSVEALSDSLQNCSTEQFQINVIHKAVGQISETDVMLASASNAIIIGFQVRPSQSARKLAEKEGVDIRLYSIIYDAIEQLKDAMAGMLAPELKEQVTGTAEEIAALDASYAHLQVMRDEIINLGIIPPVSEWATVNPNLA